MVSPSTAASPPPLPWSLTVPAPIAAETALVAAGPFPPPPPDDPAGRNDAAVTEPAPEPAGVAAGLGVGEAGWTVGCAVGRGVGCAVGRGVGCAVGRGVGCAVGRGVGVGLPFAGGVLLGLPAWTMEIPVTFPVGQLGTIRAVTMTSATRSGPPSEDRPWCLIRRYRSDPFVIRPARARPPFGR
jgi:hypothetical protein